MKLNLNIDQIHNCLSGNSPRDNTSEMASDSLEALIKEEGLSFFHRRKRLTLTVSSLKATTSVIYSEITR